jgi:hypothetical protein
LSGGLELEIVERYTLLGEERWRVRVRGTRIVVNVAASSPEEALERAREVLERVGVRSLLEAGPSRG